MYSRILQSLKIQPGEGERVALMFLYSLAAVGGGVVLGRAVSRSLFLSMLPESSVPYKFILPPFFVIASILVYHRLVPRYPMYRLITATNLLVISGLLLFRFILDSAFAASFPLLSALYIYFEIVATTVGIQFWSFAGEVFNPREAKRLFGLITAGGVFSNAITGFGLRAVSNVILPKDLIFAVAGSLLIGILCVWTLGRQKERAAALEPASDRTRRLPRSVEEGPASTRQDLRQIARQPMLVTLGMLIVVTSLVTNISDFQLDLSLQRFFAHDGQGMLAFLGTFQIFVGVIAVLFQLFVTNRVLERFGLAAGLLLLPLALAGGSLAFVLTAGAFWAMALPRGADMTLRYTINDASLNVLFLPIREDFRKRVKALLDGVVKPPITALLGLLFLLFLRDDIDQVGVQARDVVPWSYATLALVAIWIFIVVSTRKQYKIALVDRLKGYRLGFAQTEFDIKDETTVALITQELQSESSNPLRVINILEMLKPSEETGWHAYIHPLLNHKSPEVRILVAQYFEERAMLAREVGLPELLERRFGDEDAQARAAAVQAYCAVLGDSSLERVVPLLGEPDLRVRRAAIIGLMKYAGISGVMEAAVTLKQLFTSREAKEREAGAAVLGSLQVPNYYQPLLPLLDDPDDAVQRQAILSAGQLRHPLLIPKLVAKLGSPRHEYYAREALAGYGSVAVAHIAAALAEAPSVQKQIALVKVLREIVTPASAKVLGKYFYDPNDHLRAAVAKALSTLDAKGLQAELPRADILGATLKEIERTYSIHLLLADLGDQAGPILGRALRDHLGYFHDHLFSLLSLLYPGMDTRAIQRAVKSGGGQKATALELIDTMADKEIRDVMLPLVEAPLEKIVQIAETRFGLERCNAEQRLYELVQSDDPVLRACAMYQLGVLCCECLAESIHQNMDYNHPLVQETVLWAVMFTSPEEQVRSLLERGARSKFPTVRAYAENLLKEAGG